MSQSLLHLLLLIVGSIQYARCDLTPAQGPLLVDKFSHNWTYSGEDMVIYYSRMWIFQREFTFVAHDTSKDVCEVSNAYTDTLAYDLKTCNYEFTETKGEKVIIDRVSSYEPNGERISLTWHTKKMKDRGTMRLGSINMQQCTNRRRAPEMLESATSAAPQNTSDSSSSNEQIKYEDVTDVLRHMNFSWVGGLEGPLEINSTQGIFFLGQSNESDSKVNAMFMDLSTKETQILGGIEHLSVAKDESRTSRAHKKYGQCWMDTPNKMICSQQQLFNGHAGMVIFEEIINFPESVDWFAMTNLKEPAIILVTGKCSGNMCNSYTVRKIAERQQKVLFNIDQLNVKCESPSGLTNDIADYIHGSMFCFHLVCNHKYTGQENGVTLQYRKHCVKRDLITSWG